MIHSIRQFLLVSLLVSITIASSITAIGNFLLDQRLLQPHMDEHLVKNFTFIKIITRLAKNHPDAQNEIRHSFELESNEPNNIIFFQVYNEQGRLLFFSNALASKEIKQINKGFSDSLIGKTFWRTYANKDPFTKDTIIVAERYNIRDQLVDNIARNNIYILVFTYPLFGILIWLIITIALRSVNHVASEISSRASTNLEPLVAKNIPTEIKPLVNELNRLFLRLKYSFERDKRFAGDAAHELRTPLAAIKAQAQVALRESDPDSQRVALEKVIVGVDRSSHTVSQLLTLSRLDHEEQLNDIHAVNLQTVATEIIALLVPAALEKNITITMANAPKHVTILGNEISLSILVRNIVDNAIRYTPNNGEIQIAILNQDNSIILRVADTGPGIPAELTQNVFNRFYRILGTESQGSGLGLAIVRQIAKLHHATITLEKPATHSGLIFSIAFPIHFRDKA